MTKKLFAIATFFAFTIAATAGPKNFINVDLTTQETDAAPATIKLRIPMSLLNALAPQLEEAFTQVDMNEQGLDLREMWAEIEAAGPMRYADIKSDEANITVDTTENHLKVAIDSATEGQFNISLPMALGTALFGQDQVDSAGLLEALRSLEGDLMTIEGDKVNGRIWVD